MERLAARGPCGHRLYLSLNVIGRRGGTRLTDLLGLLGQGQPEVELMKYTLKLEIQKNNDKNKYGERPRISHPSLFFGPYLSPSLPPKPFFLNIFLF